MNDKNLVTTIEASESSGISQNSLENLARDNPDVYVSSILSEGFSNYARENRIYCQIITTLAGYLGGYNPQNPQDRELAMQFLKEGYLQWARDNYLEEGLFEAGWKEFLKRLR